MTVNLKRLTLSNLLLCQHVLFNKKNRSATSVHEMPVPLGKSLYLNIYLWITNIEWKPYQNHNKKRCLQYVSIGIHNNMEGRPHMIGQSRKSLYLFPLLEKIRISEFHEYINRV